MKALLLAALGLALLVLTGWNGAWAATQVLGDGAHQNSQGGWDLPNNGSCYPDTTQMTRPECLALRFPSFTTSAACTAVVPPDVAPYVKAWSTGVCNDLVNTTQVACEAQPDRLFNNGICAIVMKGDDRNNLVCAQHGGTWITTGVCVGNWIMPASSTYSPPLFTGTTNPGPGDQCLRCHNSKTEWNGPRVRDVDWYLRTGHKNMSRKVVPGTPWAGPAYACSNPSYTTLETCVANGGTWDRALVIYPSDDSENPFDWNTGRIGICSNPLYKNSTDCTNNGGTWTSYDLTWIYGDWLSSLPRAIYKAPASTSQVCSDPRGTAANCASFGGTMINNAGASYSCGRCHTTGWTSDAAIGPNSGNLAKEPEKSFPGITWDRNTNAPANVVNLSGGVTGDPNKYSSWDYWGIACGRCHGSAVDNTTNGGVPPFSAPAGMSSHHSDLTSPDVSSGSGYCTDPRFTGLAQCNAAGAGVAWLTGCSIAGACSNPTYTTSGACVANAGTWTAYQTQAQCLTNSGVWQGIGCVGDATLTTQATCVGAGKTWFAPGCSNMTFTTQTACEGGGAVWSDPRCDVTGICSNPLYTDAVNCNTNGGYWAATTDVVRCLDAGGRWTGSKTNRGQVITRLCMDCHRQETGGVPYDNLTAGTGTYDTANPGKYLKVGPAHGTFGFVSHPHGNQFLNSAHGMFSGTFNQIATGTFAYDMTGLYTSFFQVDGESANTGNGCTGCHDVHKSTVEEAFEPAPGQEGAIREECTSCHSGPYNKDLTKINHLSGPGTPLEEMNTEAWEACVSCHMPDGMHLFRINPDPSYSTFPAAAITATNSAQCTAAGGTWSSSSGCTTNANMTAEGSFTNAVWVDVDHACGQCHGGGTSQASTTGSTVANSKTITVASSTGFTPGQRVKVVDAGALDYDDEGLGHGDFESYIVSVPDATHLNLIGAPTLNVSGMAVVQNPTKNGAPYYTKAQLAPVALGMHDSAGVNYSITYTASVPTNTLTVNVNATVDCGGTCPSLLYDWNWGDGSGHGNVNPGSHTYAIAGSKTIGLTVRLAADGLSVGSVTRNVTIANPDLPPNVDGTCTWTANTWSMNVLDTSSDDGPDGDALPGDGNATTRILVDWGDGTAKSIGGPGTSFNHTYMRTGTFTVTQRGIDSKAQTMIHTCPVQATPAYFVIGGTVKDYSGAVNLASALVQVKLGTLVVKTLYTAADGSFSTGSTLKPGIYDVYITKAGYAFTIPAASRTVGPSSTGFTINALPPPTVAAPKAYQSPTRSR